MTINPVNSYDYANMSIPMSRSVPAVQAPGPVNGIGSLGSEINRIGKATPSECQTCQNRKYVDDSNDSNVSFKTPGHIPSGSSVSAVMGHEAEHVSNAVSEGNRPGKELISATVSLKMAMCPECETAYAAGGTTTTTMRYNEDNPYDAARKLIEGSLLVGQNLDISA